MSYNAFYFTMSPEDMKAVSDMPEEQAIATLRELRDKGDSADSGFWGKELRCIIEACEAVSMLNDYEREAEPRFRQLLQKAFGGNYYSVETAWDIAIHLSPLKSSSNNPNWRDEITRVLEQYDKDLELCDELVGMMLDISRVFFVAHDFGQIVVTYWE